MKVRSAHEKTLKMVRIAFLAAVEVILTLIVIPIGTINLNFGLVPIVIAGIMLGPAVGCLIGAVSGIVTMIQVLTGQAAFYVFLVATNPVMASLLCVVKTAAAGLLAALIFKLFMMLGSTAKYPTSYRFLGAVMAGAVCPIVNTGIFALGMFVIFGDAMMADPVISTWTTGGLAALIFLGLIGVNFFVELISTVVITPPLSEALFASKLFKK